MAFTRLRVRVRVRLPGQRVAMPLESCSQQMPLLLVQPCPAPSEQQSLWHASQSLHEAPSGARVRDGDRDRVRVRVRVKVTARANEWVKAAENGVTVTA